VGTAHTQAAVSTVGFISGAALLAGGAVLWATSRTNFTVQPVLAGASVQLGTSF
jgi:hypothetical protein